MHMYKDLHVLDTPFVTLRSGSPASILLLKSIFSRIHSLDLYDTYLSDDVEIAG